MAFRISRTANWWPFHVERTLYGAALYRIGCSYNWLLLGFMSGGLLRRETSLCIQVAAKETSILIVQDPLSHLYILLPLFLLSFFLFSLVHRPFFGSWPPFWRGLEIVKFFYQVRMLAPQSTPNLDGRSILLLAACSSQTVQHVWPYRQLPTPAKYASHEME